jgi:hypothetical protein
VDVYGHDSIFVKFLLLLSVFFDVGSEVVVVVCCGT